MSDMDDIKLANECRKGWNNCRSELVRQVAGEATQTCTEQGWSKQCFDAVKLEALRAFAEDQGLPDSWAQDALKCTNSDRQACEKAAALLAAHEGCLAATSGACPECCGIATAALLDLLWPTIGPMIDGLVVGGAALVSVGLESLGLKDAPDFGEDVYSPMRASAMQTDAAFRKAFSQQMQNKQALAQLNQELGDLPFAGYYGGTWYPTNYGNVSLLKGTDPYHATWKLSWDKAWQRDDAFAAGAAALGKLYQVRFDALRDAALRAAGALATQEPEGLLAFRGVRLTRTKPRAALVALGACGIVAASAIAAALILPRR